MTIARAGLVLLAVSVSACSQGQRAETPRAVPTASADPSRPLPSPVPEIVARVNGRPITLAQIVPLAKAALGRVPPSGREGHKPAALRMGLDVYMERELLLQEALARGIKADARAVDWAYDQARRSHPDEAAWAAYLAQEGATPDSFRADLRIQHTIAALIQDEVLATPVTADEIRAAYDANPLGFAPAGAQTPPSLDSVHGEVEAAVRRAKQGQVAAALVARLRSKARIELLL